MACQCADCLSQTCIQTLAAVRHFWLLQLLVMPCTFIIHGGFAEVWGWIYWYRSMAFCWKVCVVIWLLPMEIVRMGKLMKSDCILNSKSKMLKMLASCLNWSYSASVLMRSQNLSLPVTQVLSPIALQWPTQCQNHEQHDYFLPLLCPINPSEPAGAQMLKFKLAAGGGSKFWLGFAWRVCHFVLPCWVES